MGRQQGRYRTGYPLGLFGAVGIVVVPLLATVTVIIWRISNWLPADARAVVTALQQGSSLYLVAAALTGYAVAQPLRPGTVIVTRTTLRSRTRVFGMIALRVALLAAAGFTAGALATMIALAPNHLLLPASLSALATHASAVVVCAALGVALQATCRPVLALFLALVLPILLAHLPSIIDIYYLFQSARSARAFGLAWDILPLVGPHTFHPGTELVRTTLFLLLGASIIAATAAYLSSRHRLRRFYLAGPVATYIALLSLTVTLSPDLVADAAEDKVCKSTGDVTTCLTKLNEGFLDEVHEVRIEFAAITGGSVSDTDPYAYAPHSTREIWRWRNAEYAASEGIGLTNCTESDWIEAAEGVRAASVLAGAAMHRAGYVDAPDGGTAGVRVQLDDVDLVERLVALPGGDFKAIRDNLSEQLATCTATMADLEEQL